MRAARLTGVALALAVLPFSAARAQTDTPISPAAIVSAAQDCFDSFDNRKYVIDERALKKRGWQKAALAGNSGLEGIMTPFVRGDGTLMLTLRYSCVVKVNLAPDATREGVAAAISGHWGVQPTETDGSRSWAVPAGTIEFPAGNGAMVDVLIRPVTVR